MTDSIQAFQDSLDLHTANAGMEPKHADETNLFHLFVSAIEWAEARNVDLDAVLVQAREYHEREG